MRKAVIIAAVLIVLTGVVYVLYEYRLNPVESVKMRTGSYFDENGRRLGSCKEERTLRKLDSGPAGTLKTFYYDNTEQFVGYCEGDAIGCSALLDKEPRICKPARLQTQCDKTVYTFGFGATARYLCVLDGA